MTPVCNRVVFSDPMMSAYADERCGLPKGHKRPHRSPQGNTAFFSNGEAWLIVLGIIMALGLFGLLAMLLIALAT